MSPAVPSPAAHLPATKKTPPKKTVSAPSAKTQTLATDAPQAASQKYKKIPKCDRKNNKGWAEGIREELLYKMVPGFISARKEGWQEEVQKLQDIQNCYHNHFPYPMADADEPELVLNIHATSPPAPVSLPVAEAKERLKYIAEYSKRVATWMKRVAKAEEGGKGSGRRSQGDISFDKMMSTLEPNKKKARSVVQHWLHENWLQGACISAIVASRWETREDTSVVGQPPNFRLTVATELFGQLPEEEQALWKQSATDYSIACNQAASAEDSPVDIAAAVSAAPGLLFRVARGVEQRTSTRVFLMMAGPISSFNGDLGFLIINGEPNQAAIPQTFPDFIGREKTKELRELFKAWVTTCFTEEERQAVIVKDPSARDWKHHFERMETKSRPTPDQQADMDRRARLSMKAMNFLHDRGQHVPESDEVLYQAGLYLLEKGDIDASPWSVEYPAKQPESGDHRMDSGGAAGVPAQSPVYHDGEDVIPPSSATPATSVTPPQTTSIPMSERPRPHQPPTPATPTPFVSPTPAPSSPSLPPSPSSSASPPPSPSPRLASPLPPIPLRAPLSPAPLPFAPPRDPSTPPDQATKRPASMLPDARPAKRTVKEYVGSTPPSQPVSNGMASMVESADSVKHEVSKEKEGALVWTVSCLTEFLSVTSGEKMAPLILSLLRLERTFQAKELKALPKQSIPLAHRPALVGIWMKAGRCDRVAGQNLNVAVGQLAKFEVDVRKWWDGMQPSWRVKDDEGRWKRETYGIEWGQLMCPGRNGMLSVVATLSWWGRRILKEDSEEDETKEWHMMVDDVKWVIDGLIAST